MQQPLTKVLLKIFARGFYKVNAGLLIFLFVVLISYCFFINTAGDVKLLPKGREVFYQFLMLITFVSQPLMTIVFFTVWFIYTIKSWYYIAGQLPVVHHQFLFYSSNSASRLKQFKSWFYTQFIISLPFVFYAVVAVILGTLFHHYLIVALIVIVTLALISISAMLYIRMVNTLISGKSDSWLARLSRHWKKPFFSLFIYYVFDQLKFTYLLSKLLSYTVIISVIFSFADVRNDSRVAGLAILGIVMAHSIIIYQQHKFQLVYLSTARNLPYSLGSLYLKYVLTYLVILLPETIWMFISFNPLMATVLLLLTLSIAMLFHTMLYRIGLAMNRYLPRIFIFFFAVSTVILFGWMWSLAPFCLFASFILFYFNYYRAELVL